MQDSVGRMMNVQPQISKWHSEQKALICVAFYTECACNLLRIFANVINTTHRGEMLTWLRVSRKLPTGRLYRVLNVHLQI